MEIIELMELPPEITQTCLQRLSVRDLLSFFGTNKEAMQYCHDIPFWKEKLRITPRPILQNDWFVPLARGGPLFVLEGLVDLLVEQNLLSKIDENAIVLLLIYLEERRLRLDKLLAVSGPNNDVYSSQMKSLMKITAILNRKVFPRSKEDQNNDKSLFYFGDEYASTRIYHESLRIDVKIERDRMNEGVRPFYYINRSESKMIRCYERKYVLRRLNRGLDLISSNLPSANAYLAFFLRAEDDQLWLTTLEEFIVPLLIEEKATNQLLLYFKDVISMNRMLTSKLGTVEYNDNFFYRSLRQLFMYASFELVLTILSALKLEYATLVSSLFNPERRLWICHDRALYEEIARVTNYPNHVLGAGYSCMEPEEWLEWLNTRFIPSEQLAKLKELIVTKAEIEGYTYFAEMIKNAL